jgi:twinkle protein
MKTSTNSRFLRHIPCEVCGSSDGNSLYDDGHEYCHVCQAFKPSDDESITVAEPHKMSVIRNNYKQKDITVLTNKGTVKAIPERNITSATCEKYGVTQQDGKHYYPYTDEGGTRVAYKVRSVADKSFAIEGSFKDASLFGQSLFHTGGKYLTIVEGELDALAAYQMTGSQWPVVSIRNGAQAALKDCKAQYEWINSFEAVVICFDDDEPGKKAAKEVAELFGQKAKIVQHKSGYKDACEYLIAGATKEFVNAWWAAEHYRPEGIVSVHDIKERMLKPPEEGLPWAFNTLTKLTYGRRKGELYAFGAGVGIGKTDVFTQQIAYDITELNEKVGVIYLEQNVVETAQRVAGKIDKKLYHVPDANWTRDEYLDSVERLDKRDQLMMMEHFGAMDWQSVKRIIKYFAKVYDIKLIYLDHLTALSANEQDERRALDGIMADMASLAQSDGLIIHFISHLTTPDGKPHEEGGRVMEKHFTGSRAIARWAHYMFGLERDKQSEDIVQRQTTTFRVLKDRFTGRATAEKFGLLYNKNTGILTECCLNEMEAL